ncbi:acetylornithine aminotransferase apoenzyme [Methanothermus fervidus DSM 2088]|uniref:Acetylornithine aminotransferase n=1 Tax=Methanothermus fervidus (strain ATCC 43054 / DSM 2088 / JCM 10308 / V24 S) TaxID=523846 RepID=E3GYF0_METFV|nr:acetylornithine aminotransferase apoenzyme [Methanothermus fervidus DSM 2088]
MGESMKASEIMELERKYIMNTYSRYPIVLSHGKGCKVWDIDGNEYIDCFAGIAVNNIGHAHPKLVLTICHQAQKLIHCSNFYYTREQVELAELLTKISSLDKVFFANSGTEANEGAIKLARKYTGKKEIIAAKNSFHGRTLGALSATGQKKYKKEFEPLTPGFKHVPFGDIDAMAEAITSDTAAVILEPIQGEGGVVVPPKDYLKQVRELTEDNDILLILDEIQTGFGRTGEMFASELFGVEADIVTLAKAMGGGFPIGAILAREDVASAFKPGDHGSTFGGNPLACAAAKTSIEIIIEENLPKRSKKLGKYFKEKLKKLEHEIIEDVRGHGLMIGVELSKKCDSIVLDALKKGVLLNCTAENVIRLVPPLIIKKEEIDKVVEVLDDILAKK